MIILYKDPRIKQYLILDQKIVMKVNMYSFNCPYQQCLFLSNKEKLKELKYVWVFFVYKPNFLNNF